MRILVVADFTAQPCGIRNVADQTVTALRRHPGLTVDTWDGNYPELYRRREAQEPCYLPDDAADYDVIHVNWHPIAFNTYGPDHFPAPRRYRGWPAPQAYKPGDTFTLDMDPATAQHFRKPILSVWLNDIPPWSGCPFHDRADVRFTSEPSPDCVVLGYPVADWIDLPPVDPEFSVGCSTLRGDGVDHVRAICAARGWPFRTPDRTAGWLTFEQEVQRIARNTVNVLWYFEGRGKSGGIAQAVSAHRPVLISESPMFSHWADYYDELYRGTDLAQLLTAAYTDWVGGALRLPQRAIREYTWTRATQQMVAAWEAARRG